MRQLHERWADVLADHQRLLRDAFAAHDGQEVDTQGDSFFVAFGAARGAVLAAVDAQRSLLAHGWPAGVQVRVRMGIHTGQAPRQDGRYTGLAVHRAARICAAGHGGQILVSQATHTLLEDEEETAGVRLRDLGDHRLKDFDRPVRLYQVDADALLDEFPRLASAASRPLWRRPGALAAAGVLAVAVLVVGILLTRGSASGGSLVDPDHVGVVDPESNRVVGEVPVGADPGPVTSGGGSVWVANLADRTVSRIDVGRRVSRAPVALGGRTPTGIAFGAGALWIAHGLRGQLSRVDPRSKRVAGPIDVADPGSMRGAVTVGDGAVWAAYGDSTVARVDPARMRVTNATFAGDSPVGVVVANGSVWVLNAGARNVMRFDPAALEAGARGRPIHVGHRPAALTAGAGSLWVADSGDDAVTRINPLTGATSPIAVGSRPSAIVVGGGVVWVANAGDGTVSRIDPVSEQVVATIRVGHAPAGIAFAGNFVWVAVQRG